MKNIGVLIKRLTYGVWGLTIIAFIPDSINLGMPLSAFFSSSIFCLPLLGFGLGFNRLVSSNKAEGWKVLKEPVPMALFGAWLPNFIIIGLIDIFSALAMIASGRVMAESGLIYIMVIIYAWPLTFVGGIVGAFIGLRYLEKGKSNT